MYALSTAGNWLFAGRRWLDPDHPDDRAALDVNYGNLALLFPDFAAACPEERFMETLSEVSRSWRRRMERDGVESIADHGA